MWVIRMHSRSRSNDFTVNVGRNVEVGIRPEDLIALPASAAGGLAFLPEFIEELGPTRLIHGAVAGKRIVVSVATSLEGDQMRPMQLTAAASQVHLFDIETGRSLRGAPSA